MCRHLRRSVIVASFVLATACFMDSAALASVRVQSTRKYTNRTGEKKTDFHVKVWQKEDNIKIIAGTVEMTVLGAGGTQGMVGTMRGSQPEPAHSDTNNLGGLPSTSNPDNGLHAFDSKLTGACIPANACVRVHVKFKLTNWNTIRYDNPQWTNDARGLPVSAGPNTAFEFAVPVDLGGGSFAHTFTLFNDDNAGTSESVIIRNLRFGTLTNYNDIDDEDGTLLDAFDNFDSPRSDISIAPGFFYTEDVITTGALIGGGAVAAYELVDTVSGLETAEMRAGHEIQPLDPTATGAVPTVSGWGLVVLMLLGLTVGTIMVRNIRDELVRPTA